MDLDAQMLDTAREARLTRVRGEHAGQRAACGELVRALLGRRALTLSSSGAGVPGCNALNAGARPFARGCRAFESPNRARRRVSRSSDAVMD